MGEQSGVQPVAGAPLARRQPSAREFAQPDTAARLAPQKMLGCHAMLVTIALKAQEPPDYQCRRVIIARCQHQVIQLCAGEHAKRRLAASRDIGAPPVFATHVVQERTNRVLDALRALVCAQLGIFVQKCL